MYKFIIKYFLKEKLKQKPKNLASPWITPGLGIVSRNKHCLHEKFLKQRNSKNEEAYDVYKTLFEKLKKQ